MKFYRYEEYLVYPGQLRISLKIFYLIKETPCGYWIGKSNNEFTQFHERKRWVSKTSRKRFAYPTKQEAAESFKARKKRQIQILGAQLDVARRALAKADQLKTNE